MVRQTPPANDRLLDEVSRVLEPALGDRCTPPAECVPIRRLGVTTRSRTNLARDRPSPTSPPSWLSRGQLPGRRGLLAKAKATVDSLEGIAHAGHGLVDRVPRVLDTAGHQEAADVVGGHAQPWLDTGHHSQRAQDCLPAR